MSEEFDSTKGTVSLGSAPQGTRWTFVADFELPAANWRHELRLYGYDYNGWQPIFTIQVSGEHDFTAHKTFDQVLLAHWYFDPAHEWFQSPEDHKLRPDPQHPAPWLGWREPHSFKAAWILRR